MTSVTFIAQLLACLTMVVYLIAIFGGQYISDIFYAHYNFGTAGWSHRKEGAMNLHEN